MRMPSRDLIGATLVSDDVHLLSECLMVSIDLTDVTLVSDDTYQSLD